MNDLMYLFAVPVGLGIFALLYHMVEREWVFLTKEEIYKLWDANAEKFGSVEDFVRAVERSLQEKNP